MGRASASIEVPGLASDAEALWYDPVRWPAWIDGFAHVVELADGWPAEGVLVWQSRRGGRGRVLERVTRYEPRAGQSLAVEDARLKGTQRVAFAPGPELVTVTLALEYELKAQHVFTWAVDRLYVRRAVTDSLRRTLARFARERRGDLELEAITSR
jgi:polyketide cyclase/dehydrase/lipid transport protein